MPIMGRLGLLTVMLSVLLTAPLVRAAGMEAKERAARKACLSGNYAKGVEILSDLFIDTEDANYIFNQARCFEQNSRYEEAVGRFREYLRKATALSPENKADAEKHIADCEVLLGKKGAREAKPEAQPSVPVPAIPSAAPSPAPSAVSPAVPPPEHVAVASATPPAANPGSGLRIAGIACGVLGVASAGTAIYYYTRAKSFSDKVSGQAVPNPADESEGKRAQTMQWVFYSAGAVAIATGTLLYVLGWQAATEQRAGAGLAPMLAPGLVGISAQGAF